MGTATTGVAAAAGNSATTAAAAAAVVVGAAVTVGTVGVVLIGTVDDTVGWGWTEKKPIDIDDANGAVDEDDDEEEDEEEGTGTDDVEDDDGATEVEDDIDGVVVVGTNRPNASHRCCGCCCIGIIMDGIIDIIGIDGIIFICNGNCCCR